MNRTEKDSTGSFPSGFYYQKFIRNVDPRSLIKANAIFEEARNKTYPSSAACLRCNCRLKGEEAIRLSNGNLICLTCFDNIKYIQYPEVYQSKHEEYILKSEAHKIALNEFKNGHRSTRLISFFTPVLFILRFLMVSPILALMAVAILNIDIDLNISKEIVFGYLSLFATTIIFSLIVKGLNKSYDNAVKLWCEKHPEPQEPLLKNFHDPSAILTNNDRKILEIFDYWPGYPPYWGYIRSVVLNRDSGRCQISGCPSRTEIHIHHKEPISMGGCHRIENLVALCEFHHGLQPETGHERVWGKIYTQYFSMVRAHYRNGYPVKAHVRRKELATKDDLLKIYEHHKIACPECKTLFPDLNVDEEKNEITILCPECNMLWFFDQKLLEESGPQIAETLLVNSNSGRWKADLGLMTTIRKPRYKKALDKGKSKIKKTRNIPRRTVKVCPKCGKVLMKKNGRFGPFWGCSGYPSCGYTKDY